jgi:hypothetical protein
MPKVELTTMSNKLGIQVDKFVLKTENTFIPTKNFRYFKYSVSPIT